AGLHRHDVGSQLQHHGSAGLHRRRQHPPAESFHDLPDMELRTGAGRRPDAWLRLERLSPLKFGSRQTSKSLRGNAGGFSLCDVPLSTPFSAPIVSRNTPRSDGKGISHFIASWLTGCTKPSSDACSARRGAVHTVRWSPFKA